MSKIDPRRAFLLSVAQEYINEPAGFRDRWHAPAQRREMLRTLATSVGYDQAQMVALIAEDEAALAKMGVDLANEVAADLRNPGRYPGNRLYVESVTPSTALVGVDTEILIVVVAEPGAKLTVELLREGDRIDVSTHGAKCSDGRWEVPGTVRFETTGAWTVQASTGEKGRFDAYPEAIQVG